MPSLKIAVFDRELKKYGKYISQSGAKYLLK